MRLNCTGQLRHDFPSIITVPLFSLIFLVIFSLACFIVRMQYMIHGTYKIRVHQLRMSSVSLPVDSTLLVVFGESELYMDFGLWGDWHP